MLMQVGDFCEKVEGNLSGLVDELQQLTGRFGEAERHAWMSSLPKLSVALARPQLQPLHLHLGHSAGLALEYRLPASSSWCDVVLLGRTERKPAAIIMELKDWQLDGDRPGPREGLIEHKGSFYLHPSDQVRGYVEYCRRFHSTVQAATADVHGCVLFTRGNDASPYRAAPHGSLVELFPVFCHTPSDLNAGLVPFLLQHLPLPDVRFAQDFEFGVYQQDRNFVKQVAATIRSVPQAQFVLLDEQRRGFELCLHRVQSAMKQQTAERRKAVIVVEGPPGSGKSALAVQLWAALADDEATNGNVVFTTTSGCQRSNWEDLFGRVAGNSAGRGLVKSTNSYNPGLTPLWVNQQREAGHLLRIGEWKKNLDLYLSQRPSKAPDNSYAVSIVDEAHAMIDPTPPNPEGGPHSGWCRQAGPQGWHIIRCSEVSVFLMDSEQSYRDNETTSRAALERWAKEQGAEHVEIISLADGQFRCGGSKEYIDWLENLLSLKEVAKPSVSWRKHSTHQSGPFLFELVDDPHQMELKLRAKISEGRTARIAASYARKWVTQKAQNPHSLPPEKMDFHIKYGLNGQTMMWSRIWNHAPDSDYTNFIQAPAGTPMQDDPLCEVGCPYVIRGFDYDYLGVLWLNDLVWRSNQWQANVQHVFETAWQQTRAAAGKQHPTQVAVDALIHRLHRGYRILLSRAIQGIYLWVEDDETRDHIQQCLKE